MALPRGLKKIPLILKDFFEIKNTGNEKSMTYGGWSHEDGLISLRSFGEKLNTNGCLFLPMNLFKV